MGFTAYTILPFLACSLACFIALAIKFRRVEYIPQRLEVSGELDVREALLDPVGACVGSAILGIRLIVIIVTSFFKIEVWMISLPFAIAQFIWDLGWDRDAYRYTNGRVLRDLVRSLSIATTPIEELGLGTEPENGVANGPANGTPTSLEPINIPDQATTALTETPTFQSDQDSNLQIPNGMPTSLDPINIPDQTITALTETPTSQSDQGSNLQISFSTYLSIHFPTIHTALPRLPFVLVPVVFSQFILIEGLSHQGWIDLFAQWLVIVTKREMFKTVWVVGVLGVLLCNASGTNIGATILLTKIVRAAASSYVPPSSGQEVNVPSVSCYCSCRSFQYRSCIIYI